MTIANEVSFNKALVAIKKSGEHLAQSIHNAGIFALAQVNEHGNDGFAVRLMDAMGRKHDAKRVEKWLCHFGKLTINKGVLKYRARRDINPETMDAFLEEARNTPYWDLNPQEHHVFKFNTVSMLESIIKRFATANEKQQAGEEVDIKNADVVAEVQALLEKHKAAKAAAVPESPKLLLAA